MSLFGQMGDSTVQGKTVYVRGDAARSYVANDAARYAQIQAEKRAAAQKAAAQKPQGEVYGPQPEQYGPFLEDFKPGGKYYDDSNDTASESYLEWGIIVAGITVGIKSGIASIGNGGVSTFNFAKKAAMHMAEKGRYVPIQILSEAIKHGAAKPDPQGTKATMYYIEMIKNGAKYTLEVLYDKASNTIYHFLYK